MNPDAIHILLVDNQVEERELLAGQLEATYKFRVDTVNNGEEAIARVQESAGDYNVVVIDLRLGSGLDGIETMKRIHAGYPDIETIIITGYGSIQDGIRAVEEGACNFVVKPVTHMQLAVYVSLADERRRLRRTERERDWLQNMLDLSHITSSSKTPEQIAERISDQVHELFPQTDSFYIAIHDAERKQFRSLCAVDHETTTGFVCEDEFGLAGKVARAGRPVFIDDFLNGDKQIETCSFNPGQASRSYAGFPMISTDKLIGVLAVQSYQPRAFNGSHKRLLMEMTNRAAMVIENALLHQETSRRMFVLSRLYKTIAALRRQSASSAKTRKGSSLDTVLDVIVSNLKALFELDTCTIALLDKKKTRFDFRAVRGFDQKVTRYLKDLPPKLVDQVFNTNGFIFIKDVDDLPTLKKSLVIPDIKSFVILPLRGRKGEVLGIMTMGSRSTIELPAEDGKLVEALADQAATAIEDDRLRIVSNNRMDQLEVLDQIALDIANVTELGSLLRKIIEKATGLCHGTGGGIYLLKGSDQTLVLGAQYGLRPEMEGLSIDPKLGVVGKVLATKKPFTKSNYWNWRRRSPLVDDFHLTAVAGAPILSSEGKLLGVIAVHTSEPDREFSKGELQVLFRFARYAGAELEKAGLLDQLNEKSNNLELLLEFSNILAQAQDVDEALTIFVERLMATLPSSFCHILLRTRSADRLRVRKAHPAARNTHLNWHSSEGEPCGVFTMKSTAHILQGHSSIRLERTKEPGRSILPKIDAHLNLEAPLQSALLIPLRIGTKIVGLCFMGEVRHVAGKNPKVIPSERRQLNEQASSTAEKLKLVEALASQAATRIEHFRALEIEADRSDALKKLSDVGSAIAGTLDRDQVLKMIVEHGRSLLNAEASAIFLVNREGTLTLEATDGSPEGTYAKDLKLEIGPNSGLTGFIAWKGEIFKMRGKQLKEHPAIKNPGRQRHLISGFCESLLVIPLKRRSDKKEELIGLIKVENKQDRAGKLDMGNGFHEDDIFILKTLADCAVTAIQNAQMFGLTRTQQEVAKVVNSTLDLDKVLNQVLTELHHLIPFDTASIQLVTGEELKIVACDGFDKHETKKVLKLTFPLWDPKFPNHKVITTREAFLLPDIRASHYRHFWDEAHVYLAGHIRSWLGVPLLHGDEVVGMISIDSKIPKRYTELDKDLGKAFASHVVSAIVHARLYKSFQSLIDVTADITQQLNLEMVLKRITKDATNKSAFIGADIAIIHLYNPDEDSFNEDPVYDGTLNDPKKANPPYNEESVVWRFIRERDFGFRYENHVGNDLNLAREFIDREKVVSAVGLKLVVGEKPVGVMFVNYRTPHIFSKLEVGLLDLFGQLAAIAIQNARQYGSVRVNLKLARDVARAGIFASILSHDIGEPAASISAYARALQPTLKGSPHQDVLIKIEKLAKDIAASFPSFSAEPDSERFDIYKVLEAVKERRRDDLLKKHINLEMRLNQMPQARGNPTLMAFVFENLVRNAIRFMQPGGTLTFDGKKEDGRVVLEVIDTGPGPTDAIRSQLFKGWVKDSNSPGRGRGLLYSKYILEEVGGDISLPKTDERGNVFTLSLPTAISRGDEK